MTVYNYAKKDLEAKAPAFLTGSESNFTVAK